MTTHNDNIRTEYEKVEKAPYIRPPLTEQLKPAFRLQHLYVLAGIVGTILTLAAVWLLVR